MHVHPDISSVVVDVVVVVELLLMMLLVPSFVCSFVLRSFVFNVRLNMSRQTSIRGGNWKHWN